MWFKSIFRSRRRGAAGGASAAPGPRGRRPSRTLLDESFLQRLERLSLYAQRSLRGTPVSGDHPSRQRLPATIFDDHRPYSVGDDYRHVDWNAYARHEQVVVRLGETEQQIDVHLLLDVSKSMAWGDPSKLESARQLVAALGYLALAHGDRLQIAPFSAVPLPAFGPIRGKPNAVEMLRFIAGVQPGDRTTLAGLLSGYARRHERGGLLVICSDMLAEPTDGLAAGLRAFAPPRWQVLVLHVLDPRELEPALSGTLELQDAETGALLPLTLDGETVDAYRRNLAVWQEQIAAACARRGATYAQVRTDWPLERAVIPYLRIRQILQ